MRDGNGIPNRCNSRLLSFLVRVNPCWLNAIRYLTHVSGMRFMFFVTQIRWVADICGHRLQ